jgi:hypothetical protein
VDAIIRGGADGLDGLYDADIRRKWGQLSCSRAQSASVSREHFILESIPANWWSGMVARSIWNVDDMVAKEKGGLIWVC